MDAYVLLQLDDESWKLAASITCASIVSMLWSFYWLIGCLIIFRNTRLLYTWNKKLDKIVFCSLQRKSVCLDGIIHNIFDINLLLWIW